MKRVHLLSAVCTYYHFFSLAAVAQRDSTDVLLPSSYVLDIECEEPGPCFDPCNNYTTLSESWRSMDQESSMKICDVFKEGWYRFTGPGGVRIPEKCVPVNRCGTDSPLWLNGTHPSKKEGIVSRNACAHWSDNCCLWSTEIKVKACDRGFYVYKLNGTPECDLAYCTDPNTTDTTEMECDLECPPQEECQVVNGTQGCYCRQDFNVSDITSLRPLLHCGANDIKVSLDKCQLEGLGFNNGEVLAYLRDSNCTGILEKDEEGRLLVVNPTQVGACGTTLERNTTHAIYKNTLTLAKQFIIIRDDAINIEFQCAYPLDMKVSLQTAVRPIVSALNISASGSGDFLVRMALFQDQNYTSPYEGSIAVLSTESMLYVGAVLYEGDTAQFNLLLKNCYATPTKDRTDPLKYFIIRNSCPNIYDSTIRVEENGVSTEGRFSVQMFMFAGNHDLVYLHCEVHLCDNVKEKCRPSCSGIQQRSEIPINPAHVLDLGPIARRGSPSLPEANGATTPLGFLTIWPGLLLSVLGILLFH
ncbi:pancreatic secretory granule membrane major glycoprotein GP2-like isoform X1 [Gracilinanus agilis]|uniref:pancreatic secretory granule membrane major glycoprotein GP2-like isoform X1 n=1 Tax=Gracilinanus agilis TaxID=191870 RepID=UPI001CFE4D74|nr:pancreatic secretory granule membrane major glycoprotein GP2-like isoform X1 [Gracilinanus agilis]